MAKLFGSRRLKEIASRITTDEVLPFIDLVKQWRDDYYHGSLLADKETSREQQYNQHFFKEILGYTEKPSAPYSFEPKSTSDMGQLPDAIVGCFDEVRGIHNIAAVVELKGASTPLDRPQRREGNQSPVQQGFKYKSQFRSVPFVIVSNFIEFRLYNDNQLDYESWRLDDLVNPSDDYHSFKTWYGLLNRNAFISEQGQSLTEQRLKTYRFEQEEIGKDFYKEYSEARIDLVRELAQYNPQYRDNPPVLIAKAQKILDRVVFAAFAEDRGLLPEDALLSLLNDVERSRWGIKLWPTLQGYFEAIDKGNPNLDIPQGYNGGLFAPDPELNNMVLGHAALSRILKLSHYNFIEDLSVSMLGHIFEQSISDLEALDTSNLESILLTSTNRRLRKRDGIYYTPDYVVRNIVDESLGAYLRHHEERLLVESGLKEKIKDQTYRDREIDAYSKYYEVLRNVTVLDPSCRSGAFLVYAFDYLLSEHQRIGSILGLSSSAVDFEAVFRNILRNNLYGVDINDESVEITKLSLWLKTALPGKKLTALDRNIKCGNSLIDRPDKSSKSFDWMVEFREVFNNGGFDVIVGNPPYGAEVEDAERVFLSSSYATYEYQFNSYSLFFERSVSLLKSGGILGFIVPATFTYQHYFAKLRHYLQQFTLLSVSKFTFPVFRDAEVGDTISIQIRNTPNIGSSVRHRIVSSPEMHSNGYSTRPYAATVNESGTFSLEESPVSIGSPVVYLGSISTITAGIKPYQVGKGRPKQTREVVKGRAFSSIDKIDDTYISCMVGSDFYRYCLLNEPALFLSYGPWLAEPRESAPFFDEQKIVVRQTADSIISYLDEKKRINLNNVYNVGRIAQDYDLLYILALLNSRLINYIYRSISQEKGRTFAEVKKNYLEQIPIARASEQQQAELSAAARELLTLGEQRRKLQNRFSMLVSQEFGLKRWPSRLSKWWKLEFPDFVLGLGVTLTLKKKDEILDYFLEYRDKAIEVETNIQIIAASVDEKVFELYGIQPDEVGVVKSGTLDIRV